jgi:DNA-binding CsgD family transcriptional regulator
VQLSEGARPAQVAERCGISINTVRTHLRNIFDKTGVRRQSELIRLLGPLALSGR